jgi:hypothetical protein
MNGRFGTLHAESLVTGPCGAVDEYSAGVNRVYESLWDERHTDASSSVVSFPDAGVRCVTPRPPWSGTEQVRSEPPAPQ